MDANKRSDVKLEDEKMTVLRDEGVLYHLSEFFKTFGDITRIKILYILMDSELCVGDIAVAVDMSQSAVSHQLRILKQARLVRFRREGRSTLYALDDDHVRTIIAQGLSHIFE